MRAGLLILALALALFAGFKMFSRARQAAAMIDSSQRSALSASSVSSPTETNAKFETEVKPILQAKCKPCHFPGGPLYQRLPFDRPETIKKLGKRLFTRIEKEDDRRVIREFLSAP